MKSKRQAGRPTGSVTTSDSIVVVPIKCKMCGSSQRSRYTNCRTLKVSGVLKGFSFRSVTLRRCKCTKCGQTRIERHLNN